MRFRQLLARFRGRVCDLKSECIALYFAGRHPQTPWYAKLLVAAVVAYALSPIDLIPDFVPVLGLMDDLIILPLGIALAIKLVPSSVMAECRARARAGVMPGTPAGRLAAAIIIVIWTALSVWGVLWVYETFFSTAESR
jgi:uncharacterized membrane protein YkvA (DUF1232 family)